jgi:hypothetical protein
LFNEGVYKRKKELDENSNKSTKDFRNPPKEEKKKKGKEGKQVEKPHGLIQFFKECNDKEKLKDNLEHIADHQPLKASNINIVHMILTTGS